MPNWVYNTLIIEGDNEAIQQLKELVAQPHQTYWVEDKFNQETQQWENNGVKEETYSAVFNFWNLRSPDADFLNDYFDKKWYDWNCENWGTKWEASEPVLNNEGDGFLIYVFQTAWSPLSLELLREFSEKFPTLTFKHDYEEEQGWGGEAEVENGDVTHFSEYDIPQSHADLDARDRDCWACDSGEPEMMWDDCPEKEAWEEIDGQWIRIGE